ncbi:MAG: DUF4491 family protein [Bacteroidales bacterium]|nr:DUF4491 family protein [Bacteroidales bacterium]
MHYSGLLIGLATFAIIGLFHPVVIKAEYYFGTGCWWFFLLLGLGAAAASLCASDIVVSSVLGVLAFSAAWSILELFQQKKRVERGWFPRNEARERKRQEKLAKRKNQA